MRISFAGQILADSTARLPPLNLSLNSARVVETVDFARAVARMVYPRGNSGTNFAFGVSRVYASYADAEDAYFLAESQTPVGGALVITQTGDNGGRPALSLARAACASVIATLTGVRVDIAYTFQGGRFSGGVPADYFFEADEPNTMRQIFPVANGADTVAVVFPAAIPNPIVSGLSLKAPAGTDSPGIVAFDGLTTEGMTVRLSGPVSGNGFVLHCEVKSAPAQ